MILTIAKKEFLENVLSRKFLVAFVLAVVILGTGAFAMSRAYQDQRARYETRLADLERQPAPGYLEIARREIFRVLGKPNPLSTLISGQKLTPIGMGEVDFMMEEAVGTGRAPPLWARFGMLDLTFIIGFLMSLMAVIFSYDSISGEKERGTLKLTLANDVPKDHVLLGKYIGGVSSVILPFLLAILFALGIVGLTVGLPYSPGDYQAIGFLVLTGCATISAFYLLGMLISSLTKRAAVSLIVLLFLWIFVVQGVGNVAALSAAASRGMTYQEFRDRHMSIWQEVWEEYRPKLDNLWAQYTRALGEGNTELAERIMREINRLWDEQSKEASRRHRALEEEFRRQQEGQLKTSLSIARISPAESYRNVAWALAGLSWDEGVRTQAQISDYISALEREYREWQNQEVTGEGGGMGRVLPPPENFKPRTRLEWYYKPWGTSERMGPATYDIVSIVLFNILMFIGAYVAFVRYDVR